MDERFILFNESGEPMCVAHAMRPGTYVDGGIYGTYVAVRVPDDMLTDSALLQERAFNDGGTIYLRPEKPLANVDWDNSIKQWVSSQATVLDEKAKMKSRVESQRQIREMSPIALDTMLVDADAEAIRNINGKLQEISAKEALGVAIDQQALFWRDANNQTHSWPDVSGYRAWLQGLVIAIAERTSAPYVTSWGKKAEIDALGENLDLILTYDPASGWPL